MTPTTPPLPPRLVYSRRQAAEMLSISQATVDRMIKNGGIKAIKISARRLGIPHCELTRVATGVTA